MKVLGVIQFQQMKFNLLNYEGRFLETLGNMSQAFVMVVYGESGNGKTEACVQLAKEFTRYGKVAWLSYEQGHSFDFQLAVNRNKMEEVAGKFMPIDPLEKRKKDKSLFQELDEYLGKRGSPQFVFIDSLDYLRLTWEEYQYLKDKYGKKKALIFIAHATGTKPKLRITEQIYYDGHTAILVKDYIMHVKKNRFGGFAPYVIWEEKAMEMNPKFFNIQE